MPIRLLVIYHTRIKQHLLPAGFLKQYWEKRDDQRRPYQYQKVISPEDLTKRINSITGATYFIIKI